MDWMWIVVFVRLDGEEVLYLLVGGLGKVGRMTWVV